MSAFDTLDSLAATIANRTSESAEGSYTAKLLYKGTAHIAKKVGEEGVELSIAAAQVNKQHAVAESADLLFHMLVLWQSMQITPAEVMQELQRREGTSGLAEKAARKD